MSELTLNLSDYKSSGVYFVEIDNSIITGSVNSAIRLAIGYNERGPFNRPIYISSTADCDELLGDIDLKLERRGCYTNRNIRTMAPVAPVYALNLLPVDTRDQANNTDKSGFNAISFDSVSENKEGTMPFCEMYDRSKFWIADGEAMMKGVITNDSIKTKNDEEVYGPLFAFGNAGTRDISLIVRKAENLTGYNVTFLDWYGSIDAIPYKWINPYDYVADYFIQVIAVNGNYTNYQNYANDSKWKEYFNNSGIKKDALNKFLRLDAVTVLGNWIGCIIPDFCDKQGKCRSIEYLINKTTNKTGLQFGINKTALETLYLDIDNVNTDTNLEETFTPKFFLDKDGNGVDSSETSAGDAETPTYVIDMTGMNINLNKANQGVTFMSYNIPAADIHNKNVYTIHAKLTSADNLCSFVYDASSEARHDVAGKDVKKVIPSVGDYVRAANGTLTRIIKKQVNRVYDSSVATDKITFTTLSPICRYGVNYNPQTLVVPDDANIQNVGGNTTETNPELYGQQDYMVFADPVAVDDVDNVNLDITVEIHKSITYIYETLKFLPLNGLKITNKHRPGYDKNGNLNFELGIEKIYKFLEDSGIRKGLLNNDIIDFRYIVDTMGGGLGGYYPDSYGSEYTNKTFNGKKYLSKLAADKGHCTALLNLPSMSDFAASTTPIFCDDYNVGSSKPTFNVEYIAKGGNMDHAYTEPCEEFELPVSSEEAAKYTAFFAPYLKYRQGTITVLIPPAADVSNTFMSKYLGGNPYATIANRTGILDNSNIVGVEYNFDKADRDALEPFGVNPIIERGTAVMIYGDRTAYQTVNSDFNYLHVRELLNTIEVRCKDVLDDYPFTYNNANTRAEIVTRLNPILAAMKDSGALAKYEIQMDELNNTQEIIDEKFGIVDIGVWVTPNMEKIITRITVNRGSAAD